MRRVFTDSEIDKLFKRRFLFTRLLRSKRGVETIFGYIASQTGAKNYKGFITTMKKYVESCKSDADVYKKMRSLVKCERKDSGDMSQLYERRAKAITRFLPIKKEVKYLLDFGTEYKEALDIYAKAFGVDRKNVYGINVEEGFNHYTNLEEQNIILYDGIDIPFEDNGVDMIICTSVLHHIDKENLPHIIDELKRVSSTYLVVKENELNRTYYQQEFIIQHELFDGVFFETEIKEELHSSVSFMNTEFTLDLLKKKLKLISGFPNSKTVANAGYFLFSTE